jgi:hypothetical protein
MRPTLYISALFLAGSPAIAADFLDHDLPSEAKAQLERGEPYVDVWRDESRDDGAMDVLSAIDIDASPAVIWNVMTDCTRSSEIVKDMKSCEVTETAPDGSWDIRKQKVKVNFMITNTSVFRSDYDKPRTIKISRAGGDMKVQDGLWTLTPLDAVTTRVTYRAASAPKFPVPKSALQNAMRDDVPQILKNLRMAAEADMRTIEAK